MLNRPNLLKLAKFLYRLPDNDRFDMDVYCGRKDPIEQLAKPQDLSRARDITHECGTVGCAIGWGPAAGIEPIPGTGWSEYARLFIGRAGDTSEIHGGWYSCWLWCFSSSWRYADNTPKGATKRILWLLLRGLPWDAWAQRYNQSPLCYKDWEPTEEDWVAAEKPSWELEEEKLIEQWTAADWPG